MKLLANHLLPALKDVRDVPDKHGKDLEKMELNVRTARNHCKARLGSANERVTVLEKNAPAQLLQAPGAQVQEGTFEFDQRGKMMGAKTSKTKFVS